MGGLRELYPPQSIRDCGWILTRTRTCVGKSSGETTGGARYVERVRTLRSATKNSEARPETIPRKTSSRYVPPVMQTCTANRQDDDRTNSSIKPRKNC